jgi:acyl transferase domain-containing protein/SAM-dependent methyltransferase
MSNNQEPLSPVKRALLEVRQVRARLEEMERREHEPIAVVGFGLRFPGDACDADSFWSVLREGRETITEVPQDRWDRDAWYDPNPDAPGKMYTCHGGFLGNIDRFDSHAFGISPREATLMDPQQRLLLEVSWEALESAGYAPDQLRGSASGVFVGIAGTDYARLVFSDTARVDAYAASGTAFSVASGRVSYTLGLQGPSLAVDTACSSSLVAVHLAIRSLRARECQLALAGGVNVMLLPEIHINLCAARMLSRDGRCKTFDATADGYVRGEGCGLVVLRRLSDAQADGDRILAVIRGSAVNQDGRSSGLTVPNGPAQEAVIRAALADGALSPADVSYVEAHGTGTELGDPIEVRALGAVFAAGRETGRPLRLGSVKTNIGHLEAAAGVAGLIKVILALEHEAIPAHLHLQRPNPHVEWASLPFEIPTSQTAWPREARPRVAGISSFGFSGTNAHVIVQEAPAGAPEPAADDRSPHLLTLSARSAAALCASAARLADHLQADPGAAMTEVAYTLNGGRARLAHRMALLAAGGDEAEKALRRFAETGSALGVVSGVAPTQPELVFLFTGQGAQRAGMGRELYECEPEFRGALDRCAALIGPRLDRPLLDVMFGATPEEAALLDQTAYTQPALFSLEYALTQLLRSWGITPSAVLGHSLGEYVAACVAGVLVLEDALALVVERARLMQSLPAGGAMAAVFADEARVRGALAPVAGRVGVAAVNAPESVVISGDAAAVRATLATLEAAGVRSKPLSVSHAFHSPLVAPILPALQRAAAATRHQAPRLELISNLTGQATPPDQDWAAYWVRHAREAVRFRDGVASLAQAGYRVFVEIGPRPTLLGLAEQCIAEGEATWVPTLRPGAPERTTMLEALGRLFTAGVGFDATRVSGGRRRKVSLPTYPFERERYWLDLPDRPTADEPVWDRAVQACRRQSHEGPLDLNIGSFPGKWAILERLTLAYQVLALREMGLFLQAGECWTVERLLGRCGVAQTYARLLGRWLGVLAERGLLRREGEAFLAPAALPAPTLEPLLAEAGAAFADYPEMLAYLTGCGPRLGAVLSGRESPLETLFPGGSFALADGLYRDSAVARYLNGIGRAAVEALVRARPTGSLRVLEIGAGTGGTTAAILPVLPAARASYLFTDLSDLFLGRAAEKFGAFGFVRYGRFDVEKDAAAQGFPEGGFDLVVAANVLHATQNLRETLGRVRTLLADGGLLVLSETTNHPRWFDISTGLIEGWQRFDDGLRGDNPLLPAPTWLEILREAGFATAAAFPEDDCPARVLGNHVILAGLPEGPRRSRPGTALGAAAPAAAGQAEIPSPAESEIGVALRQALPDERRGLLADFVRQQVMAVLRLDPSHRPDLDHRLIDLGLDSLMAVQLRNQLAAHLGIERRLPATLVFDQPSCQAIAAFLETQLFAETGSRADGPERPVAQAAAGTMVREVVERMSDAETEALLIERLESLEGDPR